MMIVDESTTIKNRQAARTKNIVKAGRLAKYRRILTGSPVTKSPLDLFSQCNFLSPNALGFQSFFAFQNRYAIVQSRTMGHRSFQEIVGYRRLEELSEKLETFSVRLLKEDCLDLPEKIYIRRDVALTKEQKLAYDQMKHIAMAQLENGELATTQSVLTQIMRLQQICCGHLRTDEGSVNSLPNNRLSELLDIAEEVQGKVIIWATWTHDLLMIADALRRRYGPDSAATYYGGTPQDERQKIVTEFQDPESSLRFFVGQPKTGGYGITLTAANTMVYYSNSYDLEIRLQSEDRAHRIGQKNAVTYIDLVSPKTIDEKILQALRDKIDIAGKVLGENAKDWII
jgi:SNF2 family DNA or RNA helicase